MDLDRVKRLRIAAAVAFALVSTADAQEKGPIVDKILLEARTQEDLALKDVAAGRSDLFNYGTDGSTFKALPDDVKARLAPYAVTGATYVDIYINPYPNKAPYTAATSDGKKQFNPFAIREVRYALNYLISRKQIIDEILVGAGVPMYTPVIPGQPNSSRFGLVASKLGFSAAGNERKALADIDAALRKAAEADPGLAKKGQWWTYGSDPVTVKFLIRVDDPNLRLPEGRYIASQIEKAGIKVDRLEYDRAKCIALWNKTDPAGYQWSLYTDAWNGGQTLAFWDQSIAQMYAPWQSFMPGGGKAGFWQYENKVLDELTQDCVNGRVGNTAAYYDKLLKATDLGLREAVRVFVAATTSYTCANKDRFNSRMLWGAGDGIDNFSLYSADVKPEKDGSKVFKMTEFSAKGALFMSSWDPIGSEGFGDIYSGIIIKNVSDMESVANPLTGTSSPLTASWSKVETGTIDFGAMPPRGSIPVPAEAVLWNARTQKWESGINYVDVRNDGSRYDYVKVAPDRNLAWSRATFTFKFGRWHDGRAMGIDDYRYAIARPYDLCVRKGKDDKVYEDSYASAVNPGLPRVKGYVFNKDDTITVYGDVNYPMDRDQLAALLCPSLMIEASNYGDVLPWTIHEALKAMVAEGAASKTVYAFNDNGDFTEVDLLAQNCTADIKAKLLELAAKKAVPASLSGYVTPDQATRAYQRSIAFIEKHGHAVISNGGFFIDKYDAKDNSMVLSAFRDQSYPFEKGWFTKTFSSSYARIEKIDVGNYVAGKDLKVAVTVSEVAYPAGTAKPLDKGSVKVTLVAAKEITVAAAIVKAGGAEATIPAAVLAGLKPGLYTIIVEAGLGAEAGAIGTSNLIVF
jgi:peptide/nickel transport system substrate-binding protein